MTESIRATGMECPQGEEQLLKYLRSGGGFYCLNTRHHPVRVRLWPLQLPSLFRSSEPVGEKQESESMKASSMLLAWLDTYGQSKIWTINLISMIDVVIMLLKDSWRLFGSQCWDRGIVAVDIVPLWLTEILGIRTIFSGIDNLNLDSLAPPPPSINRLDSLCRSSFYHFLWKTDF